ncbi:ParB/Srx family N-terminal domain-containing protein, partial [Hahella sp. HN01]|uniref:ParB/Srx family N-terminal domain-containing protein n=1 Tax=Hahella sp. HN01 TaxID=2847262 RepID=UPI00353013EC
MAQIAASIAEFGWTNPILVDGENGVVAGHGRLLAARKLGMVDVPIIELAHLSPTQKRAYILADNQLALKAGWDEQLLRVELEALQEDGFDLDLTGFDADDLAALLEAEETEVVGQTDDDSVPEEEAAVVSQSGDVWLCGEHRVLCGDATSPDAYAELFSD